MWASSGHNDVASEPFRHWDGDDPAEVPTSCAKCHSSAGYLDYLGADGSEALKVDATVPAAEAQGIQCIACHDPAASNLQAVPFPGKDGDGNPFVVTGFGDATRCLVCHQGRESKASVDGAIEQFGVTDVDAVVAPIKNAEGNEVKFGFRNVHYFAAAATLYGTEVKGGYEYDGKMYDAKFHHVEGRDTCIGCHDPHTLQVKVDECAACHGDGVKEEGGLQNIREAPASAWDYDGDGDVEEGMAFEIQGLQEKLLAAIQDYALNTAGAEIKYDAVTYPYFMGADDKAYPNWTARLLKAAYNYQVSIKDPGAFAHGNKYIIQLIFDSIEDLGADTTGLVRDDAGHFAGNTEAFRHWDEEGEVPGSCARCHSATGLPQFLKEGATISNEISNGFMCSTCHNEAVWPERYAVTTVPFPSGASVTFSKPDADGKLVANDANLCLECHQGRESTTSVNKALSGKDPDTVDEKISFRNVHYFAAGATLFGDVAKGAYQYDGKEYLGAHAHVEAGFDCKSCHDVHALEVKVESCAGCHPAVKDGLDKIRMGTTDYDGDGDTTEGMLGEVGTVAEALYAQIQTYAAETAGTGIVYDSHSHPYFFVDADGDGEVDKSDTGASVRYNQFTPKLMKAAYNYQYSQKDPGAFAHNGKYVLQFLIDSIEDLGGNVTGYTRP
jgi:hypothetical protein